MRFPTVAMCAMAALEATKLTGLMVWAAVSVKLGSVRVSSSAGCEVGRQNRASVLLKRSTCASIASACYLLDPTPLRLRPSYTIIVRRGMTSSKTICHCWASKTTQSQLSISTVV